VIQLDDQRYWLYATVDTDTNGYLHLKLGTAQDLGFSELFFNELREEHDVSDAVFLVDGAPWLQKSSRRHELRVQHETAGNQNTIENLY
jgi:transposase-like protein